MLFKNFYFIFSILQIILTLPTLTRIIRILISEGATFLFSIDFLKENGGKKWKHFIITKAITVSPFK